MKTLADLKRNLTLGKSVTMVKHDWFPNGGELIGLPRKIKIVQSNGIQFEPHKEGKQGSWLNWHKASEYRFIDDNTFEVALEPDFSKAMTYKIND